MSKKKLNTDSISNELQGASMFFTRPGTGAVPVSPSPSAASADDQPDAPPAKRPSGARQRTRGRPRTPLVNTPMTEPEPGIAPSPASPSEPESLPENKPAILLDCHIAILQDDLLKLKNPAFKAQTFRFTVDELDRLKDLAYSLSKISEKKVTQGDLLRIGFLMLKRGLENDNDLFVKLLKAI